MFHERDPNEEVTDEEVDVEDQFDEELNRSYTVQLVLFAYVMCYL